MNQINDPDDITYKEARHDFKMIAPVVLIINLILAIIMWFVSDNIFKQEEDFLGGLLAGAFVVCGVISYIALKAMGKRVSRSEKIGKNK